MSKSSIEWTEETWNPLAGCKEISPGCTNCYAARMAHRLEAMGQPKYVGTTKKVASKIVWTGKVNLDPASLALPLSRRKSTMFFVNSMSDLFHDDVPDEFIRRVFAVMSLAGQHTFQVLTKRADRMAEWFADHSNSLSACQAEFAVKEEYPRTPTGKSRVRDTTAINGTRKGIGDGNYWPLPNVWLGVSVEDQRRADERIPPLLRTPAAVRYLSSEPLLGPVDLSGFFGGEYATIEGSQPNYNFGIDWVIIGGESGHGSRPCNIDWVRDIVRQCQKASVPCFVKQLGAHVIGKMSERMDMIGNAGQRDNLIVRWKMTDTKGGHMYEWPDDLQIREMPQSRSELTLPLF